MYDCGEFVNHWPCPKCSKELGNKGDGQHGNINNNTIKIDPKPLTWDEFIKKEYSNIEKGYVFLSPNEYPFNLNLRTMDIITFRIGHLFVHLILLFSAIFHTDLKPIIS